jgi:hypothetical protein
MIAKFRDVSLLSGLFSHVQNVDSKFNLESELVAQTYNGTSVMSGHANGLQYKALEAYAHTLFTCTDMLMY